MAMLAAIKVTPETVYMDMIEKADRDAIFAASGHPAGTLPLVFLGEKFIGTAEDVEYANEDGELKQLLGL